MAWTWREGTIETHHLLIECVRDHLPGYRVLHGDRYESGKGAVSVVNDDGATILTYHLPESMERIMKLCSDLKSDDKSRSE